MAEITDPMMIKMIENSVLLHRALADLQEIKNMQDMNHVVTLALAEHHTIERTDILWDTLRRLNGSLSVIRYGVIAIAGAIPALIATHQIWGWPA